MGVGGHGLWADLTNDPTQPTVALRVDIDALPLTETNQVTYRSRVPGVMHACGHDVHAAIGIGAAAVLSQMRAALPGNVRFIFQPEEEQITGAVRMLRAGVLKHPTPAAIFGLHVAPLPVGSIGWNDDLFLAGFDHYLVTLSSLQGQHHTPATLDAIARHCCQVIQHFKQFAPPENWPEMEAFWQLMQAGSEPLKRFIVYNATQNLEDPTAWHGQFGLGIKAATLSLRKAALGRVRAALHTICQISKTHFRIEPMGTMIDLHNDTQLVCDNLKVLKDALGTDNLRQIKGAFPFNCEDFAYYTKKIPGAMFWLGGANPGEGKYAILHTPDFDVDETCIETGTVAMAAMLFNTLSQISKTPQSNINF